MKDPSSSRQDRKLWKDLMKASDKEPWGPETQRIARERGGLRQDREHAKKARDKL
jgi:hypothetical protein